MICDAAHITGVDWNGYLKYFRPSKRFVEERQKFFAESLLMRRDEMQMHRHAHFSGIASTSPLAHALERSDSIGSITSIHSLSSLNEQLAASASASASHNSSQGSLVNYQLQHTQISPNKENLLLTNSPNESQALALAAANGHIPPILLSNVQLKTRISPPNSFSSNGAENVNGTSSASGIGVLMDSTNGGGRTRNSPLMRPTNRYCTNLDTVNETTSDNSTHDPSCSSHHGEFGGGGSSLPSTPSHKLVADPRLSLSSGSSPKHSSSARAHTHALASRSGPFSLPSNMKLSSPLDMTNGSNSGNGSGGGNTIYSNGYHTARFTDSRFSDDSIHNPNDPNDLPMLRNQGLFPHSRSCGSLHEHGLKQRRVRVNMPPDE